MIAAVQAGDLRALGAAPRAALHALLIPLHDWRSEQARHPRRTDPTAALSSMFPRLLRPPGAAIGSDQIAEVVRGPLIPGFYDVRKAALDAGAFGCTLSGSGPTLVAIPPTKEMGMDVCKAMVKARGCGSRGRPRR